MKTLWTPWRMDHVLGHAPKTEGCLFEPDGNVRSNKAELLLYRDESVVVLLNRFPYANGHLLVAPAHHCRCITELSRDENRLLGDMVQKSAGILTDTLMPDGLNIGINIGAAAGAGIADHLHYHLIPRWQDDHNFMTALAEVRTIPEHIELTYQRLLPKFNEIEDN